MGPFIVILILVRVSLCFGIFLYVGYRQNVVNRVLNPSFFLTGRLNSRRNYV